MARYVVLSFDDNDEAEDFVVTAKDLDITVEALIGKPTVFCDGFCRPAGKRVRGFFRGKKWGWWVCGMCGKPTKLWGSSFRAVISHGKNLLDETAPDPLPQPVWEIGQEEKRHTWTPDMFKERHPPLVEEPQGHPAQQ